MEAALKRLASVGELSFNTIIQLCDIALVTYLIYRLLRLVQGTRAWRILGGIVTFVAALFISDYLHFYTLHWVLDKATMLAPVALVILLLPELRQTLESFARLGLWPERLTGSPKSADMTALQEIISSVSEMSATRLGAILVIERNAKLDDIAATGVLLNAKVSAAVIKSIFYYGNPLHDGAILIRGDQIIAAACRLPLSENSGIDPNVHMRHRAGLGIAEQADCVTIIVSEERGSITIAIDNRLLPIQNTQELREFLNKELKGIDSSTKKTKQPRARRRMKRDSENRKN